VGSNPTSSASATRCVRPVHSCCDRGGRHRGRRAGARDPARGAIRFLSCEHRGLRNHRKECRGASRCDVARWAYSLAGRRVATLTVRSVRVTLAVARRRDSTNARVTVRATSGAWQVCISHRQPHAGPDYIPAQCVTPGGAANPGEFAIAVGRARVPRALPAIPPRPCVLQNRHGSNERVVLPEGR
jgi:hypothetical protein